ncbi:MAG: phage Gp19/Gp15/Gp42 family protein [Candidatus Ancillula sp.]|jgi:hypothetical protein|nr:phage Gp19/Gp15/Gp42 family protein [Candidatus Ancillula sp.]
MQELWAYANIEDLEQRWRPLFPKEEEVAQTRLLDASNLMRIKCRQNSIDLDADIVEDELVAELVVKICCNITKRSFLTNDDMPVSQYSEHVGQVSQSYTLFNPSGDMYMTKEEKEELGIGVQSIVCASTVRRECVT